MQMTRYYSENSRGIFVPTVPIQHRDDEYDPEWFQMLHDMQRRHFWYRGRHRFLWYALRRELCRRAAAGLPAPDIIDLGGGCGEWLACLATRAPGNSARWHWPIRRSTLSISPSVFFRPASIAIKSISLT